MQCQSQEGQRDKAADNGPCDLQNVSEGLEVSLALCMPMPTGMHGGICSKVGATGLFCNGSSSGVLAANDAVAVKSPSGKLNIPSTL